MSQKQRVLAAFVVIFILFLSTTNWADADPSEGKCIGQSFGFSTGGDDFSPKAGVRRNCVVLEIATGTW